MLSLEESRPFFRLLSVYSRAFIFPFQVDRRRGKLKKFSGWKFHLWLCIYSMAVIYYAQGLLRFLSALMFRREEVVLFHLPFQFNTMIIPLVHHSVIIMVFCLNADLLVMVFNDIYIEDDRRADSIKARRKFWQLPAQEQLVSGTGLMFCGGIAFYGPMVVLLNDMSHLLINMEQLEFLKSSMVAILLTTLLELWSIAMWLLKLGFLLSCNCLVLSKVASMLAKLTRALQYLSHGHN